MRTDEATWKKNAALESCEQTHIPRSANAFQVQVVFKNLLATVWQEPRGVLCLSDCSLKTRPDTQALHSSSCSPRSSHKLSFMHIVFFIHNDKMKLEIQIKSFSLMSSDKKDLLRVFAI